MDDGKSTAAARVRLENDRLGSLFQILHKRGYETFGPTPSANAIDYAPIQGARDLPRGWTDEQAGGHYRLRRRDDDAVFGYVVGPQGPKRLLFPPDETVWQAVRQGSAFTTESSHNPAPRRAIIGVRACELAAMAVQDRVFMQGTYGDPGYRSRREALFVVAVNCSEPGGTCFCASLGTGPAAISGFDLVLTEVLLDGEHFFIVAAGSAEGRAVQNELPAQPADERDMNAADTLIRGAAERMGRQLDLTDLPALLHRAAESPRWSDVARRCLGCANCTLVCPTCFCSNVEDVTDLAGTTAQRRRVWDSCFTLDFSYMHGGSIRTATSSRYRQWLTHKLAAWVDQFGVSGCVGCGRCITWCPVGIDLTEEVAAIRAHDAQASIPATQSEVSRGNS
jgi:ferredoxin